MCGHTTHGQRMGQRNATRRMPTHTYMDSATQRSSARGTRAHTIWATRAHLALLVARHDAHLRDRLAPWSFTQG